MLRTFRLLAAMVAVVGLIAVGGPALVDPAFAKGQHHHNNGKDMLGDKIKTDGEHQIHKVGKHTVAVKVSNGKVAGLHVRHADKGDVPVKKYKTKKKMAANDGLRYAAYTPVQYQDLGTTYIGYSFIDDFGEEHIYWFPYEMILDGDTGAVDYVPLT